MSRDWNLKKQAQIAKMSFERREPWMKELSHFAGKDKPTLSSKTQESSPKESEGSKEKR